MKREYSRVKDVHDSRDLVYETHSHIEIPHHVDLRNKCSPVENQGQIGSCTGHAIVGALEYAENLQREDFVNFSRLFVYYNERLMEGTTRSDAGGQIRDGIKSIAKYGVCDESLHPYDEHTFRRRPSEAAYADALKHTALQYRRVPQNLHALTHCLASRHPIVFGIYVYESFESDIVAKTGYVPFPLPTEKCIGGHAVTIMGYDLTRGLVLVRNSWGDKWGIEGYCWFPFDFILQPTLSDDFWTISKLS